ncbi:carbon storage regulator [Botrimarina mediterranea]|uniref:carbon storage regulator n=1 Tax=Botrimarina mediterranea TaxID=2528022 RepID=UPI00118A1AD9|nr:Carbon storage regulator [Planctomycetes bacterium K2D]
MLILSRKTGQEIRISDTITIVVRRIKGDRVRLGIVAPKDANVLRAELLDKTREAA